MGYTEMDEELENIAQSVFIGELPRNWTAVAPATEKSLANWLEYLKVFASHCFIRKAKMI